MGLRFLTKAFAAIEEKSVSDVAVNTLMQRVTTTLLALLTVVVLAILAESEYIMVLVVKT